MRRLKTVEIGNRFQSIGAVTGAPTRMWEVRKLFRSRVDELDYAQLACVEEPTLMKSIGVAVLLDPKHFTPVSSSLASRPA